MRVRWPMASCLLTAGVYNQAAGSRSVFAYELECSLLGAVCGCRLDKQAICLVQ